MIDKSEYLNETAEEYCNELEDSYFEPEEFGCCFPDRCLMPGLHFRHECHLPEMIEGYYQEELTIDKPHENQTAPL